MKDIHICFHGQIHGGVGTSMECFLSRWWFLTDHYRFHEVAINQNPDVVYFAGCWKKPIMDVPMVGKRVFITGENITPDWKKHEWAFSFTRDIDDPRHFRLPEWVHWLWSCGIPPERLIRDPFERLQEKTKFCLFVQRNPSSFRELFVRKLSKYKTIDCLGQRLNNKGYVIPFRQINGKIFEIMSDYKFIVSFENESFPGYNTRLSNPMVSRSIAIYWGDPLIDLDFNEKSFIWVKSENGFDEAVDRIIALDKEDSDYLAMWRKDYFINNMLPNHANRILLTNQWHRILGG